MIQRNSKKHKYFNNIQFVEIFSIFIILEIWERRTKLKQKINQKKRKKLRYEINIMRRVISLLDHINFTTSIAIQDESPLQIRKSSNWSIIKNHQSLNNS